MVTHTTEIELTVGSRQDPWETHWLPSIGKSLVGLAKVASVIGHAFVTFCVSSWAALGTELSLFGIDILDWIKILGHPGTELLLIGLDSVDSTEILGPNSPTIADQKS